MYIALMLLFSFAVSNDYTYSLFDINSNSDYYGQNISPSFFSNDITIHYFGKQT